MQEVIMYSTNTCPYCVQAKRLLADKGIEAREIKVDAEPGKLKEMIEITGRRSVPQIFIGETHVGGYDDLSALARTGQLDALLASG
jgi:glutaredoxin 3